MKKQFDLSFGLWLFCCFSFIALLIGARIAYCGSIHFLFLVWNLFLAWIPYLISLLLKAEYRISKTGKWFILIMWLLFFPNALYIVTDIIHLKPTEVVPLWYDVILLFTTAFAGLAMAFASLMNIEKYMEKAFPLLKPGFRNVLPILLLFIGAFGVYLGRFQRWNSWDIISDPITLTHDILSKFISPTEHLRTWTVTLLLTGLYSILWLFINSFLKMSVRSNTYVQ